MADLVTTSAGSVVPNARCPKVPTPHKAALEPIVPPHTLAAHSLPLLISRVALRLSRSAAQFYGQTWQIGTTEYRLLLGLDSAVRCNAQQLSIVADVDPGATSRGLQQLAKQGWIQRTRQGREIQIQLTASGRERLTQLRPVAKARELAQLQGLSQEEQSRLRATLETLLHNLARLDAAPPLPPADTPSC